MSTFSTRCTNSTKAQLRPRLPIWVSLRRANHGRKDPSTHMQPPGHRQRRVTLLGSCASERSAQRFKENVPINQVLGRTHLSKHHSFSRKICRGSPRTEKAADIGAFLLSSETTERIKQYRTDDQTASETTDWDTYLQRKWEITDRCLQDMICGARRVRKRAIMVVSH